MAVDLFQIARLNQQKENQKRDSINDLMNIFQQTALKTDTNEGYDSAIGNIQKLQGQDKFMDIVGNEHIKRLELEKQNNVVLNTWFDKAQSVRTELKKPYDPANPTAVDDLLNDLTVSGARLTNTSNQAEISSINTTIKQLTNLRKTVDTASDEQIYKKWFDKNMPEFKSQTDVLVKTKADDTLVMREMMLSGFKANKEAEKKAREAIAKTKPSIDAYGGYDPAKIEALKSGSDAIANIYNELNALKKKGSGDDGQTAMGVIVPSKSIFSDIKTAPMATGKSDKLSIAYEDMVRSLMSVIPSNEVDEAFKDLDIKDSEGQFSYVDSQNRKTTTHLKDPKARYDEADRTRIEWLEAYMNFAKKQMPEKTGLNFMGGSVINPYSQFVKQRFEEEGYATKDEMFGIDRFASDIYEEPMRWLRTADDLLKKGPLSTIQYNGYSRIKSYRP